MQAKITPKKIAVLRFSSIGDIVLISPVIRALHACRLYSIHFITKSAYAQVNLHNIYLTKQHLFDKDPREILSQLKAESFDFVVDLHKNIRSKRLVRSLAVKSYTFPKLNVQKWLLVNFKINRLPDIHIVDRYFMAVQQLKAANDGKGLDMFIDPVHKMGVVDHGLAANNYTVVVLGAAHFTKRIPSALLDQIIPYIDGMVVFLGGSAERAEGVKLASKNPEKLLTFCGTTNLQQSASLIQQARQVVTADTGMMHIAAAFHKKIIVLWGNTVPALGMYPYYGDQPNRAHSFEVENLPCRPCSKIGYDACPRGHFDCMHKQDVAGILAVLNEPANI